MNENFEKSQELLNELRTNFFNKNKGRNESDILNQRIEIKEDNGIIFFLVWLETTNILSHFYIKATYKSYSNKPFYENKNVIYGYDYTIKDVQKEAINYIKSILKNLEP